MRLREILSAEWAFFSDKEAWIARTGCIQGVLRLKGVFAFSRNNL